MSKTLADIVKDIETSDDEKTLEKNLESLAQVAEASERYKNMVQIMEALVSRKLDQKSELTQDQRNLLSVAYKNVVGAKRSSWRMLSEESQFENVELVRKYKKCIEQELESTCNQILEKLEALAKQNEERLKSGDQTDDKKKELQECQVFYLKMIGDYYRYLTEAFPNEEYKNKCSKYYDDAMEIAKDALEATHPTRLGLALNYSVCHYEILDQKKAACELAKTAFDDAIEKLDSLNDVSYRDSTLIMQLLRDNLTIWNQTDEAADAEKDE